MATRSDPLPIWFARALATYSLPIYVGGLLVIVLSRVVERTVAVPFPVRARQAVVAATLAVMVATYLAERRFARGDESDADDGEATGADGPPAYPLYVRASLAAAAVGVAIGIYVAIALDRLLVGGLFMLGAYLFVHMAYRRENRRGES